MAHTLTTGKLGNNADQYAVCNEGDGRTVAVTHDDVDGRMANLFAAAPEMLAALIEARRLYSSYRLEAKHIDCGAWVTAVDDAIAKAEGN